MTAGKDDVLTVGNAPTAMDNDFAAETIPRLSVTVIVKFDVPVTVGVPEIAPVVASRARPVGSEPEESVHVEYVPVPPVAASVWEYAAVSVPPGIGDDVDTAGAAAALNDTIEPSMGLDPQVNPADVVPLPLTQARTL